MIVGKPYKSLRQGADSLGIEPRSVRAMGRSHACKQEIWTGSALTFDGARLLDMGQPAQIRMQGVKRMKTPTETAFPRSIIFELIDLLEDFPAGRNQRPAEGIGTRLADLERRARTEGESPEMVEAIKGARLLLDLAGLPPLPLPAASP